jgi:hypothetical protein
MVGLALSAETTVDAPPAAVFNLFGAGAGAGWVFDAVCDRVAVGAVVTLRHLWAARVSTSSGGSRRCSRPRPSCSSASGLSSSCVPRRNR